MKNSIFILTAILLLTTFQSCKKERNRCDNCGTQQGTTNTPIIINNNVTINNTTTTTSDTIITTNPGGNNGGNGTGTNAGPMYVAGVIKPNAAVGVFTIGTTYWGFTSVPSACTASPYDEKCNPIAIKITGIVDGKYTATFYPTITFSSQNGYYPYIEADPYGSPIKNEITSALYLDNYTFVIVTF